jgi:hypothetical protein
MSKDLKNSQPKGKEVYEIVDKLLENIKYGSITLVIQDGKIIQIESQEKIRLK